MIQQRNMAMQVVLFIITLSLYGIYWFYVTSKEIVEYKKLDGSPGLWAVLMFVPLGAFYSYYKQGEAVEALTDGSVNKWIVFILWLVFSPASWFITQTELNKRAAQPEAPQPEPAQPEADQPEADQPEASESE